MRRAGMGAILLAVLTTLFLPHRIEAQLTDPCNTTCALVLGSSSFVLATGVMTAAGRLEEGFTTKEAALTAWTLGFLVGVGSGLALHENGERQRRAVHGSALGALGGAVLGLALETAVGDSDAASRYAATLIGSGIGVLIGGAIGAHGYDGDRPLGVPALTFVGPRVAVPWGL